MVDKDANAVLDEIEAAILQVAVTILQGNGFGYDVPSRAKGNQLYVPELDRIVLKVGGKVAWWRIAWLTLV